MAAQTAEISSPEPAIIHTTRSIRVVTPRRPEPPVRLTQAEEAALSWFLGPGRTAFERSTFGSMLERAELLSCGTVRCSACRGSGVVHESGAWCRPCNGTGGLSYELDRDRVDPDQVIPCSGDSNHGHGYIPDDTVMTRYAIVSRRLGRLTQRSRQVFEEYHGDHGIHCAAHHTWPMVAVYPLTPAGQRLARMASEDDPDYERCRLEVVAQGAHKNPKNKPGRGALIEAAERQATELYVAAVGEWQGDAS